MSISIAPELEMRIERIAAGRGIGVDDYVAALLTRIVEDAEAQFVFSAEDESRLHEGIRQGEIAVQAGRTRPAREVFADLELKYGQSLK